ncbi:MAG: His-Xaa-Ser system radical SAM maturase HxsC [Caulobacteraceae bacterium]
MEADRVLRLRELAHEAVGAITAHDAALLRGPEDLAHPALKAYQNAVVIGDFDIEPLPGIPSIRIGAEFSYLGDGDIIGVRGGSDRVRVLYRRASRHNFFLVTERCNHNCLMCSQPPKDADDGWILDQIERAIPLVDPETPSLGFTGGETLLDWRRFLGVLELARDHLPATAVHVLTNGRAFAQSEIARAWAGLAHPNLMAGIPIYAAVDHVHDYVVQARGAFDETVLGILRLKEFGQRVEIRIVLHQVTIPHLAATATWIARNLPFVDHVALMGLENTGFAIANDAILWIDPVDYQTELALAVDVLDAAGLPVSIYNLPYCVLDRSTWPFARQSISDWKNAYLPVCDGCAAKTACAGFFSSGRPRSSRGIERIAEFAGAYA